MPGDVQKYQDMLTRLQKEICDEHLPSIDPLQQEIFLKACALLVEAKTACDLADHARNTAKDADAKAAANAAFDQAEKVLNDTLAVTRACSVPILDCVDQSILRNEDLDKFTCPCAVLFNATPQGLANFCKSETDSNLVDNLLSNLDLMKEMLEAGGAKNGKYGEAAKILNGILNYSEITKSQDILYRLALGTCLELASPITEFDLPDVQVDPILRYLHYQRAYLSGELDPSFDQRTAWECRHVIDCDAPNEQLGWGREMLCNYRPDHVLRPDYKWRYVMSVRTEVNYCTPTWTASPRTYQQIISGGGECGPRAWFGRFACKMFGIPTWGVRQPGHAAMTHWTPQGWVVCLGADWKFSDWDGRWGPDFYLETQARASNDYIQVLRLQWIADALGEGALNQHSGLVDPNCFWRSLAQMQARKIAAQDAYSTGMSRDYPDQVPHLQIPMEVKLQESRYVDLNGNMIIPATSCTQPEKGTNNAIFQQSFLGGTQLHIREDQSIEYTIEMVNAGQYKLSLQICNAHLNQKPLLLTLASDADDTVDILTIVVPYTIGEWQHTTPVDVVLSQGINVLTFTRETPNFGLTIKHLTLTEVAKGC